MDSLVLQAQQGDNDAFAKLYIQHRPWVTGMCCKLASSFEAEDLAQDVFLQLYRKIHLFRGDSAFRTWLYVLARNVVYMSRRRKKTEAIDNSVEWDFDKFLAEQQPNLDLQIDLARHISNLSAKDRAAFVASKVYGFTHAEVASQQNTGLRAAKTRAHRARVKVRAAVCGN